MSRVLTTAYVRPRAYVRVHGPDAADLLQRIVSNDVLAAPVCEALILTPKGRVIAPLVVWRRAEDDFLLLTEPELGETVRAHLTRMRIAAKCEIALEQHTSAIVLGDAARRRHPDRATTASRRSRCSTAGSTPSRPDEELERLRILARTPRWGREIDDGDPPRRGGARRARRLVHEGLLSRARSRSRGCTTAAT